MDEGASRRQALQLGAGILSTLAGVAPAQAIVDYENVGYLGGSDKIDLNNANIRAYLKLPGMYPTAAGIVVGNGPYKTVSEIFNIPGLTAKQKEVLKKYESKFVVFPEEAAYVIDKFNNGLYR